MITENAKTLNERLKYARSDGLRKELSILLHYEIVENCTPTREEFISLVSDMTILPQGIWDFVLLIPEWEKQ